MLCFHEIRLCRRRRDFMHTFSALRSTFRHKEPILGIHAVVCHELFHNGHNTLFPVRTGRNTDGLPYYVQPVRAPSENVLQKGRMGKSAQRAYPCRTDMAGVLLSGAVQSPVRIGKRMGRIHTRLRHLLFFHGCFHARHFLPIQGPEKNTGDMVGADAAGRL